MTHSSFCIMGITRVKLILPCSSFLRLSSSCLSPSSASTPNSSHHRHYHVTIPLFRIRKPTFPDFSPKLIPDLKVQDPLVACGEHPSLKTDPDAPTFEMQDPYIEPPPKCVICEHQILIDYKNVQLLSQFVSQFTGRVFPRKVVGLCTVKYSEMEKAIAYSRRMGLMPYTYKNINFYDDPRVLYPRPDLVITKRLKDAALQTKRNRLEEAAVAAVEDIVEDDAVEGVFEEDQSVLRGKAFE